MWLIFLSYAYENTYRINIYVALHAKIFVKEKNVHRSNLEVLKEYATKIHMLWKIHAGVCISWVVYAINAINIITFDESLTDSVFTEIARRQARGLSHHKLIFPLGD